MSTEIEKWEQLDFDNRYFVSSFGRIKSKNKILTNPPNAKGYRYLIVRGKCYSIHRLVAKIFIPNPNDLPIVNHKNGIKGDNSADNLEWVTRQQNSAHAAINGLMCSGENHPKSKLKNKDVNEIRHLYKSKTFNQRELSEIYFVNTRAIGRIINNITWKSLPSTI